MSDDTSWMDGPVLVDPPSGWRWGFPKLWDRKTSCREWLVANGYPEHLANQDLPCRFIQPEADESTNHDATPVARAQLPAGVHASGGGESDGTDKAALRPAMGTGDTQEPVAWAVYQSDGQPYDVYFSDETFDVERMRGEWMAISGATFVPLYRTPQSTLNDEERLAIEAATQIIDSYDEGMDGFASGAAATLRSLLEKTKCTQ